MDLAAAFKELGVPDPEGWAESQEQEGIDQLTRATALRALADAANEAPAFWRALGNDDRAPAELRHSAQVLQGLDIPAEHLDRMIKATVSDVMFQVCALLDGATEPERNPGNAMFGAHAVREVDGDLKAGAPLGLHEDWIWIASTVLGEDVVSS